VIVPWAVIGLPEDALGFAASLAEWKPIRFSYTSISGAIDFGVQQLRQSEIRAARRTIDISGDGANNQGRIVTRARDEAVAQGITINGLPIMLKDLRGFWDIANLDLYYRDCVIGGPGAFMIPVRGRQQFVEAIKDKIIREIADRTPPEPLIQQAQAAPPTDCLAGE
jgi:Protein of unknown function (DUF1194)